MSTIPFYKVNRIKNISINSTISNYSYQYIFENLLNSLLCNNTKETMYWVSEIICSGFINKLWYFSFEFYSIYIHIYYPNIIVYIYEKYKEYHMILKNIKHNEIHNDIKIREYFFRIYYIFSIIHKKFIIKLFQDNLFKPFNELYHCHKQLINLNISRYNNNTSDEMIQFINKKSLNEIDYITSQLDTTFQLYMDHFDDPPNKIKYSIYYYLSFLLEKGYERFNLYYNEENHLNHCQIENKYSYFIWNIWNILLKNHKLFHLNKEINALYRLYESYKYNQSINAYYIIIVAYTLCIEKIIPKNICIHYHDYDDCKLYFYETFGYIKEALEKNKERLDKI